jgi:hypothetical protein
MSVFAGKLKLAYEEVNTMEIVREVEIRYDDITED